MIIRKYTASDLEAVSTLFYNSVHAISKTICSQEELDAWAPKTFDVARWKTLENNYSLIAEINGVVVGIADLTDGGEVDRVYVHKDYQRQGVGSALLQALELEAKRRGLKVVTASCSKVANPFFLAHGYHKTGEEVRHRRGFDFVNSLMEKNLK